MKHLLNLAIGFLLLTPALAQAQSHQNKDEQTKDEIQKLFKDLNEAILKKDRARLEQIYADEFQFVRPTGAVINKATQISGIMGNEPLAANPIPAPANDSLLIYGDTVVARHTVRSTAVTSIFVKKIGYWQLLQAQGTLLAPERKPVNVDPKLLDSFVGKYQFGPAAFATVTREGDTLRWRGGNRMPVTLVPLSETHFFAKESETELRFVKNGTGSVTEVVLRLGSCQDTKAPIVE